MVVQHNLTAMNANRYLGINNSKLSKSLEKLSSGYAINRAGDNAAGLAVSEKMRSQIAGMTQGVKNAQDGISMVQTFEGALTETDSILQRMKTLADQMANGSYDDPIDRTAAQQEFLQLNDELDQIADTDFNGVIVLNGGKMADGLEAVDGMFDYANKADQVAAANAKALADAQAAAQKNIDSTQKAYAAAQADVTAARANNEVIDFSNNGKAAQWNTVDDKAYTTDAAKDLFGKVTDGAGGTLADGDYTSMDVQFKYNATSGEWEVEKGIAYKDDGTKADLANTDVEEGMTLTGHSTANGGFKIYNKADDTEIANAIFDSTKAADGDTVTLTFTNKPSSAQAPTNIGVDKQSIDNKAGAPDPTIAMGAGVSDGNMSQEMLDALKVLDESTVSFEYNGASITGASIDGKGLNITKNGTNYDISFTDSKGNDVVLATVTAGVGRATDSITKVEIASGTAWDGDLAGKTVVFDGTKWMEGTNDVTAKISTTANTAGYAKITGTPVKGDSITFSATGTTSTMTVAAPTNGTVSFGVALDAGTWDPNNAGPEIKVNKNLDGKGAVMEALNKTLSDAKAAYDEAQAAYPKTVDDLGDAYKVSKSDAFDKSEAQMTYKDSITLQTGARTKDAVNFTFQYNSDAIGDLAADLNCTAKGLGTSELNLSTQEAANYAIDKIDQAINKVSLVRGTFGAIQNRLEHKIDNMNVSIENLTSAESQIRDTNMPQEMMNFTKQQILAQASQSMLAQANQLPQSVLSLLQ